MLRNQREGGFAWTVHPAFNMSSRKDSTSKAKARLERGGLSWEGVRLRTHALTQM